MQLRTCSLDNSTRIRLACLVNICLCVYAYTHVASPHLQVTLAYIAANRACHSQKGIVHTGGDSGTSRAASFTYTDRFGSLIIHVQ